MKVLVVMALAGLFAAPAMACEGEAQLIAPILKTAKTDMSSCKAYINVSQVKFFSSSQVCPLILSEIAFEGIEVGLVNGHDCRLDIGQEINGVVAKNKKGLALD